MISYNKSGAYAGSPAACPGRPRRGIRGVFLAQGRGVRTPLLLSFKPAVLLFHGHQMLVFTAETAVLPWGMMTVAAPSAEQRQERVAIVRWHWQERAGGHRPVPAGPRDGHGVSRRPEAWIGLPWCKRDSSGTVVPHVRPHHRRLHRHPRRHASRIRHAGTRGRGTDSLQLQDEEVWECLMGAGSLL